jgi:hypothetical protein
LSLQATAELSNVIKYKFKTDIKLQLKYETDCDLLLFEDTIEKEAQLLLKCPNGEHKLIITGFNNDFKSELKVRIMVEETVIEPPIVPPTEPEIITVKHHHHKKVIPSITTPDYSNQITTIYVDTEGNIIRIEYSPMIPIIEVSLGIDGTINSYKIKNN